MVDSLLYNCPVFCRISSICHQLCLNSLLLCANADAGYFLFAVQNGRIPPQNGDLLLSIDVSYGIINLSLPIDRTERSVLIMHSDSWIFCLIISPLVPLRPLVGLRLPSKIPAFSHSASICLLHLCLTLSKTQHQNTLSLSMLVLSSSDTQNLNGYIGWCGCGEILISLYYTPEVFCLDQKKSLLKPQFSIRLIRGTVNEDNETRIGDTTKFNCD
jgi:hypothetical protein